MLPTKLQVPRALAQRSRPGCSFEHEGKEVFVTLRPASRRTRRRDARVRPRPRVMRPHEAATGQEPHLHRRLMRRYAAPRMAAPRLRTIGGLDWASTAVHTPGVHRPCPEWRRSGGHRCLDAFGLHRKAFGDGAASGHRTSGAGTRASASAVTSPSSLARPRSRPATAVTCWPGQTLNTVQLLHRRPAHASTA